MTYCIGVEECGCEVMQDNDAKVHIEYCPKHKSPIRKVVERLSPHIHIRTDAPCKSTIDVEAWQALLNDAFKEGEV